LKTQLLIIGTAVVLTVIVVFTAVILGYTLDKSSSTSTPMLQIGSSSAEISGDSLKALEESGSIAEVLPGTISIPGYDTIKMASSQLDQAVKLYNPAGNVCLFLVTMYLPDGKEIYRSDILKPGEYLNSIRLMAELEPGIYKDALLVYSCFSKDTLQAMNGATVKFTLEVI